MTGVRRRKAPVNVGGSRQISREDRPSRTDGTVVADNGNIFLPADGPAAHRAHKENHNDRSGTL
jgi:hypothetical protein